MRDSLILTPLEKAVSQLNAALEQPYSDIVRDASIQRFEYTYELCWKSLKRYLKQETGIEESNLRNLYREAAKQNIIDGPDAWFVYHKARNLTSHTYNEMTADETYIVAKKFAKDAAELLKTLQRLTND